LYKNIVLAYDGSLEGRTALREGALLALRSGARIHLLAVIPELTGLNLTEDVQGGVASTQQDHYTAVLNEAVEALSRFGRAPNAKLAYGDPTQVITAFAKQVKADLVVVGHRRQSLLERWWQGPSGAYLTDHVKCSVLLARADIDRETFLAEVEAIVGRTA